MTQEALKLALEALEVATTPLAKDRQEVLRAIIAIKEALARTELCKYGQEPKSCTSNPMDCQCAIDASLAQTQEPVAWRTFDGEGGYEYRSYEDNESYADDWNKRNPNHVGWVDELYTHSQRTWVDLTDEQIDKCYETTGHYQTLRPQDRFAVFALARAIEAELKELNT